MTTTRYRGTTTQEYSRDKLVSDLKAGLVLIETTLKSYEEQLAKWREEAPKMFAETVANFNPDRNWFEPEGIKPPKKNNFCSDWRVQRMNKSIMRLNALADNKVRLRADDPIFEDINLASCL